MKYCPNCGNELPDTAGFCNECGCDLGVRAQTPVSVDVSRSHGDVAPTGGSANSPQGTSSDERVPVAQGESDCNPVAHKEPSKNKNIMIGIIATIVAVSVFAILGMRLGSGAAQQSLEQDPASSLVASSSSASSTESFSVAEEGTKPVETGDDGGGSDGTQGETAALQEFRRISANFDQGWALDEELGDDGNLRLVALLLSKDHDYCAYIDLRENADSTVTGSYTFGQATAEDNGKGVQTITVSHNGDSDKLNIIFNAWGKDNMVSIKDPWGEIGNLTAVKDIEPLIELFEDALA